MAAGAGSRDGSGAGGGAAAYIGHILAGIDAFDADLLAAAGSYIRLAQPVPAALAHCRGLLDAARAAVLACGTQMASPGAEPVTADKPGPALRSVDRLLRDGEDG